MFRRIALVSAVAMTLGAGAAVAQAPQGQGPAQGGPAGFAQRRTQALLQGITLTPAQQARVDSIVAATAAQMPAFTPGQMPDSASRARRMELTTRQDSTIRAMLTPEQQQAWDRNAAAMPQRRGPRPPGS